MRAHPVPHSIAVVGAVLFAVSVVALSRAVAWVTDNVIVPGLSDEGVGNDRLVAGFLLILGVAALRGAGAILRRYYLAMAEYRTGGTWRAQLFAQYLRQPLSFHRSRPTGELLAHTDNDLVVAGMVLKPLAFAVATVVLAVLAVISLTLVHPLFGVVAFVLLPILIVLNRVYSEIVTQPAAEVQQAVAEVTNVAHESFDGVMVVKTLGRTDDEVDRLRRAAGTLRTKRLRVGRLRAVFEPLLATLPDVGVVVLLLLGAWLIDRGSISLGELVGAMSLFTVLGLPIRIVGFFLQSMPASVVALERIDKVLDLPLPDAHAGSVGHLDGGPLELRFDGVSFAHGDDVVLDHLDLEVHAGETVALVGATGSGKTTILELASGLVDAGSGSVALGGVRYSDLAPGARAERLAMVFQETFLFAVSIRENITMGEPADQPELEAAAATSQAHDFITATPGGYGTVVGERGVTLSGGQRQRVALARALFRKPSVLLLDDATSAVDPSVESAILEGLHEEAEVTVLMVAHRLSTIRLADRVAFLENGRIAGIGSHDELLALDGYSTLVRAYESKAEVDAR
ncbi:MAG: ABC transporter ATP-binding protein [Acidimicrobiales bacterium]